MSLMRLILDAMKDPDVRRRAQARPADAAHHYGIPEQRVTDYLKMMGDK